MIGCSFLCSDYLVGPLKYDSFVLIKVNGGTDTTTTSVGTAGTSQPPVPTPGGFLAAGEQDWNVDTTSGTKDWAEDNAGEWGGDAPVRICFLVDNIQHLNCFFFVSDYYRKMVNVILETNYCSMHSILVFE